MTLPIFNQPHAIDFDPTDFWGFKTTPRPELSQRWLSYAKLGSETRFYSRFWVLRFTYCTRILDAISYIEYMQIS